MMLIDAYRFTPAVNTDDFSVDSLSSYTEFADVAANWSITGGSLNASIAGQSILTRNGVSFANGEVSCVISEANDAGLVLRLADNSNYLVAVVADASNGTTPNRVSLFKRVGGTFTSIGFIDGAISFTRGTPHQFSFSAVGSTLIVKFDGVIKLNLIDGTISAPGKAGPRSGSNGAFKMESFSWPA